MAANRDAPAGDGVDRRDHVPVTVGMPVYNGAGYLEQALAGLSAQTFRDFILIVSDNNSTDDTWDILQRWSEKDPRIILFRQPENIGALANFQFVMEAARSPFFAWHAHDDFVNETFLEALFERIKSDPGIDLAAPLSMLCTEEGLPRKFEKPPLAMPDRPVPRVTYILDTTSPVSIYGLFRMEAARQVMAGVRGFPYVWGGDSIGLLPIYLSGRITWVENAVAYKRITTSSQVSYGFSNLAAQLKFLKTYVQYHHRALAVADLPALDRLRLLPALWRHAWRTSMLDLVVRVRHGRKLLFKPIRWPYKKIARAFQSRS